jgi:hypothetical protein
LSGKYVIPAGVPVYLNTYAGHNDKNVWPDSDDLSAFDPRHFWDPDRNVVVKRDKLLSFALGKLSPIGHLQPTVTVVSQVRFSVWYHVGPAGSF